METVNQTSQVKQTPTDREKINKRKKKGSKKALPSFSKFGFQDEKQTKIPFPKTEQLNNKN